MIKRCQDLTICPVFNLELYVKLCDLLSINLGDGHFFRTLDSKGEVSASLFTGSAITNRLSLHLSQAGINSGETMHSFRSGCSITLSLLSISPEDVARKHRLVFPANPAALLPNGEGYQHRPSIFFRLRAPSRPARRLGQISSSHNLITPRQ